MMPSQNINNHSKTNDAPKKKGKQKPIASVRLADSAESAPTTILKNNERSAVKTKPPEKDQTNLLKMLRKIIREEIALADKLSKSKVADVEAIVRVDKLSKSKIAGVEAIARTNKLSKSKVSDVKEIAQADKLSKSRIANVEEKVIKTAFLEDILDESSFEADEFKMMSESDSVHRSSSSRELYKNMSSRHSDKSTIRTAIANKKWEKENPAEKTQSIKFDDDHKFY